MGDIADGLLDGTFDSMTGEYLGEGYGYPRSYDRNSPDYVHRNQAYKSNFRKHNKNNKKSGIVKWLIKIGVIGNGVSANSIIRRYGCEELKLAQNETREKVVDMVSDDFDNFHNWVLKTYKKS